MKRSILKVVIGVLFCFGIAICRGADGGEIKEVIAKLNQQFVSCLAKDDASGVSNMYAKDAALLAPNMPIVKGRENIAGVFRHMVEGGMTQMTLTTVSVWSAGSIVAEEGVYTLKSKNGQARDTGKYIVLWKQEGGQWRIYRDIFNSDLEPGK